MRTCAITDNKTSADATILSNIATVVPATYNKLDPQNLSISFCDFRDGSRMSHNFYRVIGVAKVMGSEEIFSKNRQKK